MITTIKNGGIAVIATDTIYGIVCSATQEPAIKRLREIKERGESKAFIVLISSYDQLNIFTSSANAIKATKDYWPGPVSIVLPVDGDFPLITGKFEGIAFRMPDDDRMIRILEKTGPLVAPSANPEGKNPATTIEQARSYFGDKVDHYEDRGGLVGSPSKLIKVSKDGRITVIRE